MNPAAPSASSPSVSSRQAARLSHTPASHRPENSHELGSSLVHARQTLYFCPLDESTLAPAPPARPEAIPAFKAQAPFRIVAPGGSTRHITSFAFQTLCDLVDGVHESANAVRPFGIPVSDLTCAALGKLLQTRMRESYNVPDFSLDAFAGITGLASLVEDVPTATVSSSVPLKFDLQRFRRDTGLHTEHVCASTTLTPHGHSLFAKPDAIPVIDVLLAFHAYRTSGGTQPSLPFIRGDRHRRLCAEYREARLATE